jgi:hypothetical protein
MTIEVGLTDSFRLELLQAGHDFDNDVFKLALYTGQADLLMSTTQYKTSYEISGTGYTAGGNVVNVVSTSIHNGVAVVEFENVTWPSATISARAGMIYNTSNSNASVCIIDFGLDVNKVASDLTIVMPTATANEALIRLRRG